MNMKLAIKERISVRAFTNDAVANNVLKSVLELALCAPSWGNTQPWEVYVVTGDKLKTLKKRFTENYNKNDPVDPDLPIPSAWPDACAKRYKTLGKTLFEHLGISGDDVVARKTHYLKMFEGFGAPVFVYVCLDKRLSTYSLLDAGIFIQTLCLAALEEGLGSCILTHLILYANVLREELAIPNTKNIVMGVALGYEDPAAHINSFKSRRESNSLLVKWIC
jgi:nitroreductase